MLKSLTLILLWLCSHFTFAHQASSLYQIDLIVFTNQNLSSNQIDKPAGPLKQPKTSESIILQPSSDNIKAPYHLLPASQSQLRNAYWALNHNAHYDVLFHYSWLQSDHNQRAVTLPDINYKGWNVAGVFQVKKDNYYSLDTKLLFSAPNTSQTPFLVLQQQHLKNDVVYYLDHPQAGMIIKVHQIV